MNQLIAEHLLRKPKCECETRESPAYSVIDNITAYEDAIRANQILALCGHKMYIVKARDREACELVPRKPDLVIGIYQFPKPHVREIPMRENL